MQPLDKKKFTMFLEHTMTCPAVPENYNSDKVTKLLGDVLSKTGIANRLYDTFCELLVYVAEQEIHPGNIACSIWSQGFQMGRAYAEWLVEQDALERMVQAPAGPAGPGQAPGATVSPTPSPGQAPKPGFDSFGRPL